MTPEDLSKIPKFPYNGVQLSYERGYEILGGRTIYLVLQTGFTSGLEQKVLIILNEEGKFVIENQSK